MRCLADLAFMLGQCEFAVAMYRLAAQDYLAAPNSKWYAGAEVRDLWLHAARAVMLEADLYNTLVRSKPCLQPTAASAYEHSTSGRMSGFFCVLRLYSSARTVGNMCLLFHDELSDDAVLPVACRR